MKTPGSFGLVIVLLSSCLAASRALAQTALTSTSQTSDSKNSIFIQPFLSVPMLSLDLKATNSDGDEIYSGKYDPDVQPDVGINVIYASLNLSLSLPIPSRKDAADSSSDRQHVKTRYHDYHFSYFRDYWGIEAGWHQYKGFNGSFAKGDSDDDDSDDEIARPDIKKGGEYVEVTWIPLGDDLQFTKGIQDPGSDGWSWSPVGQLGYDREEISAHSPLIPKEYVEGQSADVDITGGKFESYVAAVGAGGKYRKGYWQGTGIMLFGRTLERATLQNAAGPSAARSHISERFGVRLNGQRLVDRWVIGLAVGFDKTTLHLLDATIDSEVGTVVASVGTNVDKLW